MRSPIILLLLLCALSFPVHAANFTIINGQIFTPGLAIIDAPQPNTPLGGDTLQIALDISGDGALPLPPYAPAAPTAIHNITIFLSSYLTGLNLTITNGTASSGNASLGDILYQEPGSTVKHVNWIWPDCFVGNGPPTDANSKRGVYNITIHQSFTLNATNYYTIFNLPISITNSIPSSSSSSSSSQRPNCSALTNPLLSQTQLAASADTIPEGSYPWTNGRGAQTSIPAASTAAAGAVGSTTILMVAGAATVTATVLGTSRGAGTGTGAGGSSSSSSSTASSTPAFGDPKPDATPGDGLGAGGELRPPVLLVKWLVLALSVVLLWVYM